MLYTIFPENNGLSSKLLNAQTILSLNLISFIVCTYFMDLVVTWYSCWQWHLQMQHKLTPVLCLLETQTGLLEVNFSFNIDK